MFGKKQETTSNPNTFDIGKIVAAAQAMPASATPRPGFLEDRVYPEACARMVSMWAHQAADDLRYSGETAEAIEAKIKGINAEINKQAEIAADCRVAILKEVGGFEGMEAYTRAGLPPKFDQATLIRQRAAEEEAGRLNKEKAQLQGQAAAAKRHEVAKNHAAAIVAALLVVFK